MLDAILDAALKSPELALAAIVWVIVEALRSNTWLNRNVTGPLLALAVGLLFGALFVLVGWIPFTWVGITRAAVAVLAPQGFQASVFKPLTARANGPPGYVNTPRIP